MRTASAATLSGDAARVESLRSRSASAVATSGQLRVLRAAVRDIGGTAAGALLRRRVEIDLHVGAGEHDRADVAAFHHHAAGLAVRALPRDEHAADARDAARRPPPPCPSRACGSRRRRRGRRSRMRPPSTSNTARSPSAATAASSAGRSRRAPPSTPARDTSRRCRCADSRAAPRRRARHGSLPGSGRAVDRHDQAALTPRIGNFIMRAGALFRRPHAPPDGSCGADAAIQACGRRRAGRHRRARLCRAVLSARRRVRRAGRRHAPARRAPRRGGTMTGVTGGRPRAGPWRGGTLRARGYQPSRATGRADPARPRRARRRHRRAAPHRLRARPRRPRAIRS